ncbi:hypothetical protein LSH36_361g01013 [Paralvinella palmiformis]|uniref:Uncharacterized protein n=1 Tax=Paralvinella palmiformis TaxID=53620 RepID=A0AAD9JF58_9ANNE|nr:hypothetical protein LSH36_361g01013 [Paralvinella palmiformis]
MPVYQSLLADIPYCETIRIQCQHTSHSLQNNLSVSLSVFGADLPVSGGRHPFLFDIKCAAPFICDRPFTCHCQYPVLTCQPLPLTSTSLSVSVSNSDIPDSGGGYTFMNHFQYSMPTYQSFGRTAFVCHCQYSMPTYKHSLVADINF